MITKYLKTRFPNLYRRYELLRRDKEYRYMSSLNVSDYANELRKIYKAITKEDLNLENPRTYTEKIQWAKLYDVNPQKIKLTDKYLVRQWVEETIGKEYLIPLFGVWDAFDEIDFEILPDEFVLKTNNACATNIIVKDKNSFDKHEAKNKLDRWMKTNFAYLSLELQYRDIKPKIIAEQYMADNCGELNDYKFLCFGGEVYYCWVDVGRYSDHRRNCYDLNWELQEWGQDDCKRTDGAIDRPQKFDLMIKLAKKMCQGFPHVRVDFYNVNGKIYFGEMTFTTGSGFQLIKPAKYNLTLGNLWDLPIEHI